MRSSQPVSSGIDPEQRLKRAAEILARGAIGAAALQDIRKDKIDEDTCLGPDESVPKAGGSQAA